jgi:hypothetical protein
MASLDAEDLAPSAPTAKTLNARVALSDPHLGHLTAAALDMLLMSCSNFWPQDLQEYS